MAEVPVQPAQSESSQELFGSPTAAAGAASSARPMEPTFPPGGAPTVNATSWGSGLIDTRAYGKLKTFSGKEEDWATWAFVARSYLDLLSMGFRELLVSAEAAGQATEIRLVDMSPMARTHAWTLFNVLTQSVEGRALSVIMNSEASNGLQAWRLLVDAYEPRVGGRYTAMLMGIIGPQWHHIKEQEFLESLDNWELQIRRYEDQSRETVTEATRCAVVMKNAPGGIRTALRTSSSIIGSDYTMLKKAIKEYLQTGVEFDGRGLAAEAAKRDAQGPAPMEIGAVSWKGGKKGKEDKGKGKKGKQGKSKSSNVKGKFSNKSYSGYGGGNKFQGNCSYCGKWGHKKSECRLREKEKKGKGGANAVEKDEDKTTNAIQYQSLEEQDSWRSNKGWKWQRVSYEDEADEGGSSSASGSVTVSWRGIPGDGKGRKSWADEQEELERVKEEEVDYDDDDEDDRDEASVVSAVISMTQQSKRLKASSEHDKYIMYDSGSDEHVCKPDFGGRGQEERSTVKLSAVSGDALAIIGERKVILTLAGKQGPVEVEVIFQVSKNAQKNILSSGKMFKNGFKAIIDPGGTSCLMHAYSEDYIPMYMYGNSFYVKLLNVKTVPMKTQMPKAIVAPVSGPEEAEEEQAVVEHAGEAAGEAIPERELDDRFIEGRMTLTPNSTAEKEEYKRREKEAQKNAEVQMRNKDLVGGENQVRAPGEPSEEEKAKHMLTHLPTASWCEHCTRGKGREDPHKRTDGERAVVQIDYSYLKANGNFEEMTEDPAVIVMTAVDRGTGFFTAMSIPTKKLEKDYVVKSLKAFVSQLGHVQVTIRSDGEPQILTICQELRDELNKLRGKEAVVKAHTEQAPRYSPQSMGAVGSAQRVLKGDFLTLRSDIEEKLGAPVTPAMNLWPWMIRHAAWVRGRFGIKANMRTAFEDAFGNQYTGQILPFGECVLAKIPSSASGRKVGGRQLKGDSSWELGVFLGKVNETDEFLVGNSKGVHSVRTVRRLTTQRRWNADLIQNFRGVPWNRETTIGRPRKPLVAPTTPQPAPTTPKPAVEGTAGPRLPQARGVPAKRSEETTEDKEKKKAKVVITDSSARLDDDDEPMVQNARAESSGGPNPADKRTTAEDRENVENAVKRWKQQEAEVEARFDGGGPPKKLKVGEQTIGALFNAADEPVQPETEDEMEIDEGYMDKSYYYNDQDEEDESWVNVPITAEEEIEGKKKELQKMDDFKTYSVVPKTGVKGPILDSTWVKARKPDGSVRMRYCLREFKSSTYRDDVYAVSTTSATGRLIDFVGVRKKYCFFTGDATNAFWQVPIEEECYMYPPDEWLEREAAAGRPTDVLWKLEKEWYGRRVAGTRWVEFAAGIIVKKGCVRSELAPWLFHHPRLDISLELHMDDIYGCGPEKAVKQFLDELHQEIKMKSEVHLPGCGEFYHLKRRRIFEADGSLFIQSDSKHLRNIQKVLELNGAKGAPTPAVAGGSNYAHADEKLKAEDASRFKTAVGTMMYVAPDRPDCQFAIREMTKSLCEPTVGDMQALVRLTRYLIKTKDYGIKFEPEETPEFLDCYSDTDWGNCRRTRKSTACGVFMVGKNVLASYCRGLSMICLSSGEAEFNGGVCACSEGLFYHQLLGFLGVVTKMRVFLDSSAARGVFQRQGAGRIRHLEIKSLWVQTALRQRKFTLHAVNTNENVADVGTKALSVQKLEKFRDELGVIAESEFKNKVVKIQTGNGLVGAVQLQTMVKAMVALGLMQPARGEESEESDQTQSNWVFDLLFMVNVLQVIIAMMWLLGKAIGAVSEWWKKKSQGSEAVDETSQCVRGGVRPGEPGKERKDLRRRGVNPSAASSSSEAVPRPSEGGDKTPSQRSVRSQYAYEKKEGINVIYDRCYPFDSDKPPKFYKSSAGECVHMNPQCRGLRNRKSPVQMLKVCAFCHEAHAHRAMRLVPCNARGPGEAELRDGAGTDLASEAESSHSMDASGVERA
eukprot:s3384_g4.t1